MNAQTLMAEKEEGGSDEFCVLYDYPNTALLSCEKHVTRLISEAPPHWVIAWLCHRSGASDEDIITVYFRKPLELLVEETAQRFSQNPDLISRQEYNWFDILRNILPKRLGELLHPDNALLLEDNALPCLRDRKIAETCLKDYAKDKAMEEVQVWCGNVNDLKLVAGARAEPDKGFSDLCTRKEQRVRGFVTARVKPYLVNEVCQRIQLKISEKLPDFTPSRGSFDQFWIYWANISIKQQRSEEKREREKANKLIAALRESSADRANQAGSIEAEGGAETEAGVEAEGGIEAEDGIAAEGGASAGGTDGAEPPKILPRRRPERRRPARSSASSPVFDPSVLMMLTLSARRPLHQLIAFLFHLLGIKPEEVFQEHSDTPLGELWEDLKLELFENERFSQSEFAKVYGEMDQALESGAQLGDVLRDPKARAHYAPLLQKPVGTTSLRDYFRSKAREGTKEYSDDCKQKLSEWINKTKKAVFRQTERICPPHQLLVYLYIKVLLKSPGWVVVQKSDIPLVRLICHLQRDLGLKRKTPSDGISICFEVLRSIIERGASLRQLHLAPDMSNPHLNVDQIVAKTTLKDYFVTRPGERDYATRCGKEILAWTDDVAKRHT